MRYAATGHRPPRLGLGYDQSSRNRLSDFAKAQIEKLTDVSLLVSGGAQGWDQAVIEAAIQMGVPYLVAVPFVGQESKWPKDAQELYRQYLAGAQQVVIVCDGPGAGWKFIKRDEWMVDNSDRVLALYDGEGAGGTAATVDYAVRQGRLVVNAWDAWKAG